MLTRFLRSFKANTSAKRLPLNRKRVLSCETLEKRELFAVLTGELLVNTTTAKNQSAPALAAAPDGRSVAVWVHEFSSTDYDVFAQRFDAAGNKTGSEIRVAKSTRKEYQPDVAIDRFGDFVVTWVDQVSSNNSDIKAQRFTSLGALRGSTIIVASTSKNELFPSIGIASSGNFVIAWQLGVSSTQDDILAKRFLDNGALSSSIIVANSSRHENYPDVAVAPDGRFAISYGVDTNNGDVTVKRYSATGALASTHLVATGSTAQYAPRISMDNFANTMVVWYATGNASANIMARRISNTGLLGSTITVVNTVRDEIFPEVAMKRDGTAFVVAHLTISSDRKTFSSATTELTIGGTVRRRDVTGSLTVLQRSALAFGVGSSYIVLQGKNLAASGWDVYRRRGLLT